MLSGCADRSSKRPETSIVLARAHVSIAVTRAHFGIAGVMRREPHRRNLRARYRPQNAPTLTSLVQVQARAPLAAPAPVPRMPRRRASVSRERTRTGWSAKRRALVGIPLVLLGLLAAVALPVLIEARQAYNQIFVTPAPHLRVALNAQGTPIIVMDEPTPDVGSTAPVASQVANAVPTLVTTPTPPANDLPDWDKHERVNLLLLGIDEISDGLPARSDTMIIVTINPETKQVGMLSIPRDLLVSIPNYGADKINAAYAYGSSTPLTGAGLARATVEFNFGIPIHYVVEVDFDGFEKIVDTLGGVTIDVPAPVKDDEYPSENYNYTRVYFTTGLQHLTGKQALRYSRTRHDDGDFARGNRQQQVLIALREQGLRLNLISKAAQLLDELGNTFRTDLSPRQALALAKLGSNVDENNIHAYNLQNATSVSWLPNQPYYLVPDWPAVRAILTEMTSR